MMRQPHRTHTPAALSLNATAPWRNTVLQGGARSRLHRNAAHTSPIEGSGVASGADEHCRHALDLVLFHQGVWVPSVV